MLLRQRKTSTASRNCILSGTLQPVEVPEKMCDVVVLLGVTDQACRSIKHRLQTVQQVTGNTSQLMTVVRLSFQLIVACYCVSVFSYY